MDSEAYDILYIFILIFRIMISKLSEVSKKKISPWNLVKADFR